MRAQTNGQMDATNTQNARLSKSLQMCCHQDIFMVVIQKVVKVVSIDNQKVLTMTTQILCQVIWHPRSCHDDNFFGLSGRRNRHRQIDNLKVYIVVNMTPFWRPYDNFMFCVKCIISLLRGAMWSIINSQNIITAITTYETITAKLSSIKGFHSKK